MTARISLAHAEGNTVPTEVRSTGTWVLALTSVASLMVALDLLVVSTALSTIRLDLDAPIAQLQWTVTAYGLTFAVLLMTGAALGDRFGRRRVFTAAGSYATPLTFVDGVAGVIAALAVPPRPRTTSRQLATAGTTD